MSLLVITAVDAERDAVLRDVAPLAAAALHVIAGGVGPVAAAVSTMAALSDFPDTSLVISAGVAGGFRGRVQQCEIAVASRITFADLGARTDAGHLTLDEMGLRQDSSFEASDSDVAWRLASTSTRVVAGEILTLACMTGRDDDAQRLAARHPEAIAEAMEGFGVAASAKRAGLPFAEIRAISNLVGTRDRSTWNMRGAFDALSKAFAELVEEPMP
jgi:futalosine hydrolase